jgi:hypothetical protein
MHPAMIISTRDIAAILVATNSSDIDAFIASATQALV